MKRSLKRNIEIILTLTILAGWFMPYSMDYFPIEFIFPFDYHFLTFNLTIPLLVTIPYLLILIFKNFLGNSLLRLLKVVFLLLFLFILGYYIFMLIEIIFDGDRYDFVFPIVTIFLSLTLLVLNFKYITIKSDGLQNIMLACMTLPFIFFLFVIILEDGFSFGVYLINFAFLSLYVIALNDILKNYKVKKNDKQEKTIG
ncbi:hypothetical protein ACS386_08035 [Flavobacteriaceae bacterium LMO-SS05]